MICSKSKYNKDGNLIYRITSGEKVFPEVLEVEYNEKGEFQNQSLYDLIKNEDGTEHKKMKLRTELIYNEDGKVVKAVSPESIIQYEYSGDDNFITIAVPLFSDTLKDTTHVAKSLVKTEFLLKNEDGSDKPDSKCFVIEESGKFDVGFLCEEFFVNLIIIEINKVHHGTKHCFA